jgi:hypothetical protein
MRTINHRGKGSLVNTPSKLIYHGQLKSDGCELWSEKVIAYQNALKRIRPSLDDEANRVLVELQGAEVTKIGTSTCNLVNARYGCLIFVTTALNTPHPE